MKRNIGYLTPSLKWNKSDDGHTQTKCGRFEIEPKFIGRTRPQAFTLYDCRSGARLIINRYCDTQSEAKQQAERLLIIER